MCVGNEGIGMLGLEGTRLEEIIKEHNEDVRAVLSDKHILVS